MGRGKRQLTNSLSLSLTWDSRLEEGAVSQSLVASQPVSQKMLFRVVDSVSEGGEEEAMSAAFPKPRRPPPILSKAACCSEAAATYDPG